MLHRCEKDDYKPTVKDYAWVNAPYALMWLAVALIGFVYWFFRL